MITPSNLYDEILSTICNHFFNDPLPPTFGMFEIIRFRLSNIRNAIELDSSNFWREYFRFPIKFLVLVLVLVFNGLGCSFNCEDHFPFNIFIHSSKC